MEWINLLEATEYLNLELEQIKVKRLKGISENGQYYLTFWGHYSAGKSRLINNILGKDILPVQVRETTAVMTYIRYDKDEFANIYYENGTESTVSLDEIKKIYQNNEKYERGLVEDIEHIEVFLNNPLLERGLVIVDTPGVNTVISKHQDLAISAIELSRKIVYVLGGALTKADENFIRQIKDSGIDMLFVRTKCDLLNVDEENPLEALQKEEKDLKFIYGEEVRIHFVSNLPEKVEWYQNLSFLIKDLHTITDNIHEEFERSFEQQKRLYADRFTNLLTQHLEEMDSLYRGQKSEVQKKLDDGIYKIHALEEIMKRQSNQFESNISRLKNDVKNELPGIINQSIESYCTKLDGISYSQEAAKTVEKIYQEEVQKAIGKLQRFFQVNFDEFVTSEERPLHGILSDDEKKFSETPTFREMEQQNAMVLKQYTSKLEEVKHSLQQLQKEKEEASGTHEVLETNLSRVNYEDEIREIEEFINSIPKEIAMVESENQPLQPSKVLRRVGQAIDLALLVIPGTAIASGVKAVANTTKVASALNKSGKVGKLIKIAATSSKNINKADKVRDVVYTLKNTVGKINNISRKDLKIADKVVDVASNKAGEAYEKYKANHGVLDMLEVAFWTEKIGKNFDKPVKMEVDIEEERQKKEYRNELYQKKTAILLEYNKKRQEYNISLSKQEEIEKEEEDKKRILIEIEKETEKKAAGLLLQANHKVLEDYKKQYLQYFEKNLNDLKERMMSSYFQALSENTVFHIAQLNQKISDDLVQEKARLELLLLDKSDKEKITVEMERIKELIEKLAK